MLSDRIQVLEEDPVADPRLEAVDGGPGTGKSTHIIQTVKAGATRDRALCTYSLAAEKVLVKRIEKEGLQRQTVGTVYKLTWPWVSQYATDKKRVHSKGSTPWNRRAASGPYDSLIQTYTDSAPGGKPKSEADLYAEKLHNWDGYGDPPFDLDAVHARGPLRYILPVAKWMRDGADKGIGEGYDEVILDEAQDMSRLELGAALALLREGGRARAYLDPGQAIFAQAKTGSAGLPPAWTYAGVKSQLVGGFRVGDPTASFASRILNPVYERPASVFCRNDGRSTKIFEWEGGIPPRGLILGLSRHSVAKAAQSATYAKELPLTAGVGDPEKQPVFSTIHSAKGFEASEVYLLPWPHRGQDSKLARLAHADAGLVQAAYVAVTRATTEVHISCSLLAVLETL